MGCACGACGACDAARPFRCGSLCGDNTFAGHVEDVDAIACGDNRLLQDGVAAVDAADSGDSTRSADGEHDVDADDAWLRLPKLRPLRSCMPVDNGDGACGPVNSSSLDVNTTDSNRALALLSLLSPSMLPAGGRPVSPSLLSALAYDSQSESSEQLLLPPPLLLLLLLLADNQLDVLSPSTSDSKCDVAEEGEPPAPFLATPWLAPGDDTDDANDALANDADDAVDPAGDCPLPCSCFRVCFSVCVCGSS